MSECENTKLRFIVITESTIASWASDIGSLGSLAGLIYVNHQFGAGNTLVDIFGVFLLFGYLVSRSMSKTRKRWTRQQLRDWAQSDLEDFAAEQAKPV